MQPCNCGDPICPRCGAEYEKAMAESYARHAELCAQLDDAEWNAAEGKCNTCGGISHGKCRHVDALRALVGAKGGVHE